MDILEHFETLSTSGNLVKSMFLVELWIFHTCQVSRKSKSETARGPRIFAYNLVIERAKKSGAQVLRERFFALINRHKLLTERDKQYCFVLLISFTITESIIYL